MLGYLSQSHCYATRLLLVCHARASAHGVRSSEVVGMQWSEVDLDNKLWIVPAERTKARREHRVPLFERAVELLAQQRKISSNSHVWQTPRGEDSISIKSFYQFLTKNMGVRVTIHGFRSSFRDWAAWRARLA
jgi:integrase